MNNEEFTPLTIFKASAGSGKTYTLSATYIAQLLSVDAEEMPHKHQLAVTFTNKATAEMKTRIVQYLYDIATGDDDNDGFFKTVRGLVPAEITNSMLRVRARKALFNIIHDYDHFHVTTIDSFFQSLLSSLAHELSLSASFKVELGDKEVLSKAVDRLLTDLQENGEELKWLTIYIKERMNDDKSWNVADELKSLASQILKESYMLHSDILKLDSNKNLPGAINLDNATVDEYKETLKKLIKSQRQLIADKATAADQTITSGIGYDHISGGTRSVKPYLEKLSNTDLPLRDLKAPTDTFLKYASGEKNMLKKADQDSYANQAETVRQHLEAVVQQFEQSIYVINSCSLSIANLNPLRLLDAIDKEVSALNHENDRMLLARTPLLFHDLRGESDTSFVFERAGTRYHHVMIDEFQDTSRLQWDNMRQLLIENMSQGNSCMLVGDVKQGIYRWRGGDWNALAGFQKGKDPQFHLAIDIQTLKTNFRSGEEVVKFNNRIFTTAPAVVMSAIEEVWGNYDYIQDVPNSTLDIERIYPTPGEEDNHEITQITKFEGGFVRVELLNNETEEQKAERKKAEKATKESAVEEQDVAATEDDSNSREASVAEQMMRLHEVGVPYGEMAILIRSKNDAQPLMKYFEKYHGQDSEHPIALMSEEAFLLESSPSVMTIINALRYVSNREDKIALAFLRMQCPDGEDFGTILTELDRWSRERYSGLPFYEVSCRIASMFQLHDRKGQSPYLYFFLDAVLAYIDDHSADVKAFLEYWDESLHQKSIPSAAVDGVRILTIHKSKGLAFHSVFIPYCDWKIDNNMHELIWTLPSQKPFSHIPFLPIEMKKEAGYSIYRDVFKQETFDRYTENLNLLYVAFTRTKQNLLVWADCSVKGIATILRDTLATNEDVIEYGSPSARFVLKLSENNANAGAEGTKVPAMRSSNDTPPAKSKTPLEYKPQPIFINFTNYTPRLVFRQSNNAELFLHPDDEEREAMAMASESEEAARREELQEEYRMTGILLHELMSTIEDVSDVDAKINEAARLGQLPASLSTESVRKLITRRISHPTARQWFDGSWRLYRECSLVFREKDETGREHIISRRPDRVMMRGNVEDGTDETIIIDFKFGKYQPRHREQVERYVQLIKSQGRHNVKGYLWYLYTGSIEPV